MSDTLRLNLPLLDAAQAQKHVTVNEALVRVDALAARRAESRALSAPPEAEDGAVYLVGPSATGVWAGQEGALAVRINGGWVFVAPWQGLSFWIVDEGRAVVFTGPAWVADHVAGSSGKAATVGTIVETDHALTSGTVSTTGPIIPDKAVVLGVSARVIQPITGATSWSLGISGSPDRYGSGYGTSLGAFAHGVTGQPQAYYGGVALELRAAGGAFTAGEVRLAVHCLEMVPPA